MEKVRAAEKPLRSEKLTEAVARSLFKLMAYKDEYEVSRLHTRTGFEERLRGEFEEGLSGSSTISPRRCSTPAPTPGAGR